MNLTSLFDHQRKLDQHILDTHPELAGQDLLPKKILALQVEIAELANEWRGFKFWSKDQEPRTEYLCDYCKGTGFVWTVDRRTADTAEDCPACVGGVSKEGNPLLEEYVDCLHFILSIGLDFGADKDKTSREWAYYPSRSLRSEDLLELIEYVSLLWHSDKLDNYWMVYDLFRQVGYSLRFTDEQIETAYHAKNATNHLRQETGY